jgi:hypothetical protein
MKRFVLVLVGALFLALAGCGEITTEQAVAGAQQTIEVASLVPTATPTPVINEMAMIEKINANLSEEKVVDSLSRTVDAIYQVTNISFDLGGGTAIIFQIDIMCTCVRNQNCCVPERMFVVLVHAMKATGNQIIQNVPTTIQEVNISCFHGTYMIGIAHVSWENLQNYLVASDNQIGGYQLGGQVVVTPMP